MSTKPKKNPVPPKPIFTPTPEQQALVEEFKRAIREDPIYMVKIAHNASKLKRVKEDLTR